MSSFIDRLLPRDASRAPDERRRARLLIIFSLVLTISIGSNLPILLAQHVWSVFGFLSVSVAFCVTTPLVFRTSRSLAITGNWMMVGISIAYASVGYTGGYYSPGLVWWGTAVVVSVMILGTRAGLVWTGIFVAEEIAIFVLEKAGVPMRDDIPAAGRSAAMLSSVATCTIGYYFLARLYENLKQKMLAEVAESKAAVERAHASARAVLNNVSQGLVIAQRDGRMNDEVSQALLDWFGAPSPNATVFQYFRTANTSFAEWLEVSWEDAFADVLPLEMVLGQLPARFEQGDRQFSVAYRPISKDGQLIQILVVVTDITQQLMIERAEEQQRELLASMQKIASDRAIFVDFLSDMRKRVQGLGVAASDRVVDMRELHTIKGNAGFFGLTSIARHCHQLESRLLDERRCLEVDERAGLTQLWATFEQSVRPLLGESDDRIQLSPSEYNEALRAVAAQEPYPQLASRMSAWADEPTERRLSLFADQARALAQRLNKEGLSVQIDDGGMRLPRERLSEFWSAFVHVIRNAVDHGIESPDERRAAHKPTNGQITLSTKLERSVVTVRVVDDGRGIDWVQVSERATAKGLPHETREDLEQALFSGGISTKNDATEISGRGVGMSTVRDVVTQIGGSIQIQSAAGRGTELTFLFPLEALHAARPAGAALPAA
jgi:two-component system chemotaxis sensor kinase CheA